MGREELKKRIERVNITEKKNERKSEEEFKKVSFFGMLLA